jgi:hypothetical protein
MLIGLYRRVFVVTNELNGIWRIETSAIMRQDTNIQDLKHGFLLWVSVGIDALLLRCWYGCTATQQQCIYTNSFFSYKGKIHLSVGLLSPIVRYRNDRFFRSKRFQDRGRPGGIRCAPL